MTRKEIARLQARRPMAEREALNAARRIPTARPTVTMRHRCDRRRRQKMKDEVRLAGWQ
jgi:hypothetical protein